MKQKKYFKLRIIILLLILGIFISLSLLQYQYHKTNYMKISSLSCDSQNNIYIFIESPNILLKYNELGEFQYLKKLKFQIGDAFIDSKDELYILKNNEGFSNIATIINLSRQQRQETSIMFEKKDFDENLTSIRNILEMDSNHNYYLSYGSDSTIARCSNEGEKKTKIWNEFKKIENMPYQSVTVGGITLEDYKINGDALVIAGDILAKKDINDDEYKDYGFIKVYDLNGKFVKNILSQADVLALSYKPQIISIDSLGNIYTTDAKKLIKFSLTQTKPKTIRLADNNVGIKSIASNSNITLVLIEYREV